jgi:tetratricopeptide (TPR) repeat protein
VHLDGDATSLLSIRNDLNRLDQTPLGSDISRLPIERFQVFAAAALVLLLLSWFLPSRIRVPSFMRLRRVRPNPGLALVVLALFGGACAAEDTLRDRNQAANEMFSRGEFSEALAGYQDLLAERPDIPELSYNAGNTLHRLQEYERAITETQRALPPSDPRLGADTYFALGNHLLAMQRLEEAYVAYRNALLLVPGDQDAKHNLELTLLMLNQRDNPQDPSNPNNQGQGQGTPQPGEGTPQPGEGTPGAGEGTPQPGEGTTGAGGTVTPQPGQGSPQPGTPQPGPGLQRALEEALAGINEDLTFEEAINILDLLRQQQQRQIAPGGGGNGPDY